MKADSISVQDFFHPERRHLVPLYQRPYVWKREDQWEPLWDDVRELAERVLAGKPTRPHFLGAIVLDQMKTPTKEVPTRLVIDGQQRLTTLQLLMGALRERCPDGPDDEFRRRLDPLTRNDEADSKSDDRFKVWPTNLDRPAFRVLMDGKPGRTVKDRIGAARAVSVGLGLVVEAFDYFHRTLGAWLREAGESEVPGRTKALLDVLRHRLNLVVIDLGDDDEAQVIFETLNARGTPLLPADLVKNYLFHAAEDSRADIDTLYDEYWKPFDEGGEYWRKEVKLGRFFRPQIDLFLQHYLTLAARDEISTTHLFSEFKDFAANQTERTAEDHLRDLHSHGIVYRRFSEASLETRRGMFFHRLAVMETNTLLPFLLGLFQRYDSRDEGTDLDGVLIDLESFLVRRMICRLTTKNYNQLFVELLGVLDRTESAGAAAAAVRRVLLEQTADSRLWPDDDAFASGWFSLNAYRDLYRPRLRMVLEALEAEYRTELSERIVLRGTLTIEHLLPRSWQMKWPLPEGADAKQATERRESMVHRLGNLTLLTSKLNPLISNGDWTVKHPKILEHSALALNRRLRSEVIWDEAAIERRTGALFEMAKRVWPRPEA